MFLGTCKEDRENFMKTSIIIWVRTIECRLVKYRACGIYRGGGEEKCVKIVALNMSVDCVRIEE